jgi:diguanylate cyclase (GGDEF)-like protein
LRSPVPDLELDPVAAEAQKRARTHSLFAVEIPVLRVFGFLFMAGAIFFHGRFVGPPVASNSLHWWIALSLGWAAVSSLVQRTAERRGAAMPAALASLAVDFVPITGAIWLTGADKSLLFFIPMAHVANQASRGSLHVLAYGHIGTAAYVGMLFLRSGLDGPVDWPLGLGKAFFIWAVCIYIAVASRPADVVRRRLRSLLRLARELVRELNEKTRALEDSREALHAQATRDAVTGLWNRSAILDVAERGLRRARHQGSPFAVVLADLDWFKDINDAYGHLAGDRALYETARRMQSLVRPHDAVGRWGGEEFLVVLPDCGLTEAAALAERLRAGLEAEEIRPAEAPPVSITSSFGVAATEPGEPISAEALVRAADHALYRAKRRGRNRVEVAEPEPAGSIQPPPLPAP